MIEAGRYRAKAVEGALGFTNGGKEQVAVVFEILDGENAGQTLNWYGYFSEKTTDRTLESLMHAGWDGNDLGELRGLGSKEVSLQIAHEPDLNGEMRVRVQWVNALGGGLQLKERMNDSQKTSFAKQMRGRALSLKKKLGVGDAPDADEEIPF